MLTAIKRMINKTPTENSSTIIKKVDELNQNDLNTILTSKFVGEGVYGIEQFTTKDFNEMYVFTPSLERLDFGEESQKQYNWLNNLKALHCYDIEFNKPSFLPIYQLSDLALLNDLPLLVTDDISIFFQVLFCKRIDNWKDNLINQYEQFLKGNDEPFSNRIAMRMQTKLMKLIEKSNGSRITREPVEDIEQKILEDGYRVEIRLMIQSGSMRKVKMIENEIRMLLQEFDYFNELELFKNKWKKDFVNNLINKEFSSDSQDQIFSFNELQSIILPDSSIQTTINPQTQTNTQQVITESKSTIPTTSNIPLHLLPIGEKKEREIDNEVIAELPMALKKAKAIKTNHIEIVDTEMGATVQRITCKIPDDHVYSDIKGKHEDIKAVLGNEISVIQGSEPNTVTFLIPCSVREVIYLKELIEDENFLEFAKDNALPFICGIDMHNKPVYKCLTKAPHLLVAGATNSGKSVFVNALLITLIMLKNPNELRIILIDPKKVELSQYEGFSHVEKVITDMDEAIQTLDKLVIEMEKRYDKFSKAKVKKIDGFNKQGKEQMPYIICAIDEYNDLKMQHPDVEEYIERLGQKARASGIHLILATQRPDKDVMSGVVKTNLPSRIAFKLDNTNEYRTVFGTGIPYKNLLGFGDGVVKFVGQAEEFIRFQSPAITIDDDVEERTYDKLKKFYKGEIVSNLELSESKQEIEEPKEDPLNQLKRIVANKAETRTAELQKEMGIRINKVSELRMKLVEEGWLEKEGNKFIIVASEEELNKWRDD